MMILLYAVLAYLLYKLIFSFIIPVYRTTRKVRQGLREMQEQMRRRQGGQPQQPSHRQTTTQKAEPKKGGEYIDFEEIR